MLICTLGNTIKIPVESKTSAGVPVAGDAAPTYAIRTGAGLDSGTDLVTGTTAAIAGVAAGNYRASHDITGGNGFAAGEVYYCIVSWAVGAAARSRIIPFLVT